MSVVEKIKAVSRVGLELDTTADHAENTDLYKGRDKLACRREGKARRFIQISVEAAWVRVVRGDVRG